MRRIKGVRVRSPLMRAALLLLCAIWTWSGWTFMATRSFTTRPRRSTVETVVDGAGAVFAGALFVALGLIALAILMQGTVARPSSRLALLGLLLAVPATFVLCL